MYLENNNGNFECKTKKEAEDIIRKSTLNPFDNIWIGEAPSTYPCLTMLINGSYACVHYFFNDCGDMWQSIGESKDDTTFEVGNGQPDFSPYEATISIDKAIACMNVFFDTHQRPDCIQWREL